MNGNESYLVLRFGATANAAGEAAISISFPLNGPPRKLTKISIKTETPCNPANRIERALDLTVKSSDFGASKFLYWEATNGGAPGESGAPTVDPFDKKHVNGKSGRTAGRFRDCDQCIVPFDTCPEGGYPPPDVRPPYDVEPPVEGTLFLIDGSLSGFDPNTTVSGLMAAVFE